MLFWSGMQSGRFSIKSVGQLLTPTAPVSWVFKHAWARGLHLKFSYLVWRIMHSSLPISDILFKFNVHGPSGCFCCDARKLETMQHIFLLGDLPTRIWRLFESPFGFFSQGKTICDRCMGWWFASHLIGFCDGCYR